MSLQRSIAHSMAKAFSDIPLSKVIERLFKQRNGLPNGSYCIIQYLFSQKNQTYLFCLHPRLAKTFPLVVS